MLTDIRRLLDRAQQSSCVHHLYSALAMASKTLHVEAANQLWYGVSAPPNPGNVNLASS